MPDECKVWRAGKARQEELDEIDQCRLCEIMPELAKTCYATEYCHRQLKMDFWQVVKCEWHFEQITGKLDSR